MNKDINTEEKILQAARSVFLRKGMAGARMQEIADEAGINKALLHYYFRSKDKLFEAIFEDIFTGFFRKASNDFLTNMPIEEKISGLVDSYIQVISENPYVPLFILNEINRDNTILKNIIFKSGLHSQSLELIFTELRKNLKVDPKQMLVSLIGMCVFPYAARPLLQNILFEDDRKAYELFLSERKEFIKNMLIKFVSK
jgi:AcrR family transcriptional regulator